jgi:hypothetical protein
MLEVMEWFALHPNGFKYSFKGSDLLIHTLSRDLTP